MRAARRPDDLTFLLGAFALMALLTIVSFLVAPVDSSPRPSGSTFSVHKDGAKAAYLVLKELGHRVERSYDPIASLRAAPGGTILVLASPAEGPSRQDVRALRTFIENGGIVLVYGEGGADFVPGARQHRGRADAHGDPQTFRAAVVSALTAGVPEISARNVAAQPLDASFLPVFGSLKEPAVVTARIGHGRVMWCLDDTPVTNEGLPRASNLRFLANAAGVPGERRILWDEHYHGQRRSLWSYLAATPLPFAGAQFVLAALAGIAAVGRRRGPIRARVAESRTSPLEFVDTVASLYERAGAERAALEAARDRLRRRLATASGLAPSTPDVILAKEGPWRLGIDAERVAAALRASAESLRRGVPRAAEAVPVVAELQELTNIAAQARAGRTES